MSFETEARAHIASRGVKGTKSLYTKDLSRWLAFCVQQGDDPNAPTLTTATKFKDGFLDGSLCADKKPMSAQTVRRMLSALSSMYNAAGLPNVFNGKRLTRPPADEVALTAMFAEGESTALIEHAKTITNDKLSVRDVAVMQILYDTGLRISSVLAVKRGQITRRDGRVAGFFKVKKKGLVEVELSATSVVALDRWLAVAPLSDFVFPSERNTEKRLDSGAINKRIETYGKALGITNAHPHRFRATFITEALDAGIAPHKVQASVHHADPKTTQRYDRRQRGLDVASDLAKYREQK